LCLQCSELGVNGVRLCDERSGLFVKLRLGDFALIELLVGFVQGGERLLQGLDRRQRLVDRCHLRFGLGDGIRDGQRALTDGAPYRGQ
jgi:hypothetical protein